MTADFHANWSLQVADHTFTLWRFWANCKGRTYYIHKFVLRYKILPYLYSEMNNFSSACFFEVLELQ